MYKSFGKRVLAAQLLITNGFRVIGVDIEDEKLKLGKPWGVIPFNPKTVML